MRAPTHGVRFFFRPRNSNWIPSASCLAACRCRLFGCGNDLGDRLTVRPLRVKRANAVTALHQRDHCALAGRARQPAESSARRSRQIAAGSTL